jgi:hypothetical protein
MRMSREHLLSRREFVTSVSALALTGLALPKIISASADGKDVFIVVNGWVLKRSETA